MATKWNIEFYEDAQGHRPIEKWLDRLSDQKAEANQALPSEVSSVLLRIFVSFEGNRVILLLGAYDKGKNDSASFQQEQIEIARKRLRDWKRRRG